MLAMLLAWQAAAVPAVATSPTKKPVDTWTLPSGVSMIFSYPKRFGNERALVDPVLKVIRYTPPGETISVSNFVISDKEIAKALVAAKKRKVNVQVTVGNQHARATKAQRKIYDMFKKALGTDIKAKSYYKVCKGSCYDSNNAAAQHAKVLLSSRVVTPSGKIHQYVTFISSANFSKRAAATSWNQTLVVVGDKKVYVDQKSYLDGMRHDKPKHGFSDTVSGKLTVHSYPTREKINQIAKLLDQTKCKAAKGYGKNGKTVIRVAMSLWTTPERPIAKQLAQLKKNGCDVAVIVTKTWARRGVVRDLLKAGVPVWDSLTAKGEYNHTKMVIIDGKIGKHNRHLITAGSANFSGTAKWQNTENIGLVNDEALVSQGLKFFDDVAKQSKRVKNAKEMPKRT